MYIVINKKTKKVIYKNPAPLSQKLCEQDVYADYDSKTMTILKTERENLPQFYEVKKGGTVVELDKQQQVKKGLIQLNDNQKIENNIILEKSMVEIAQEGTLSLGEYHHIEEDKIKMKSTKEMVEEGIILLREPFMYLEQGEIQRRTVAEVLSQKLLKTLPQYEMALELLKSETENSIVGQFSPGKELKITKEYLTWLKDGQPENDERENSYLKMEDSINKIKFKYADLKEQIKDQRQKLK